MARPSNPRAGHGSWRESARALVGRTYSLPPDSGSSFRIISESHYVEDPTRWKPHRHPAHELVWVRRGTMTARISDRVFTITEGFGLWIPAGVSHSGRLTAGVGLYDAFFSAENTPAMFESATAIAMTPILQSLLVHLARSDLGSDERMRAEAVVFDVLEPADEQLAVRVSEHRHVGTITSTLIDDPGDERSVEDWAQELGVSVRTIARSFREATGLSFLQWRQLVRIHRALELLGDGVPVHEISARLGYSRTGSFIDAFKRVMGSTPGAFSAAD